MGGCYIWYCEEGPNGWAPTRPCSTKRKTTQCTNQHIIRCMDIYQRVKDGIPAALKMVYHIDPSHRTCWYRLYVKPVKLGTCHINCVMHAITVDLPGSTRPHERLTTAFKQLVVARKVLSF